MAADLTAPARPACTVRTGCAGCGSPDLRVFLDLGSSPLADRFPLPGEAEDWYPLRVAYCGGCRLAQLLDVVPDGELFGDDYGFRTASSPALAAHYGQWASQLLAAYPEQCARGVVEIGCNDGTLLRHFAAAGCNVLGIDPSAAAADAAAAGVPVAAAPFSADLAGILEPAGLVIACNVAAHVTDPLDFLSGVRALLAPSGVAIVEFQYLGDLLAGCMLDHVYHEHRFFYSGGAFVGLAAQAGLYPRAVEHTAGQGGSIRVTLAAEPSGPVAGIPDDDALCSPHVLDGMQVRAEYARDRLQEILYAEWLNLRTVAGYGAPAKSATLLNFAGAGPLVQWAEDLTPGKIGREMPGTRIPVVRPGERGKPDTYLLLAWNYLPQVLRREQEFLAAGGRLIVPGPVPVVI